MQNLPSLTQKIPLASRSKYAFGIRTYYGTAELYLNVNAVKYQKDSKNNLTVDLQFNGVLLSKEDQEKIKSVILMQPEQYRVQANLDGIQVKHPQVTQHFFREQTESPLRNFFECVRYWRIFGEREEILCEVIVPYRALSGAGTISFPFYLIYSEKENTLSLRPFAEAMYSGHLK